MLHRRSCLAARAAGDPRAGRAPHGKLNGCSSTCPAPGRSRSRSTPPSAPSSASRAAAVRCSSAPPARSRSLGRAAGVRLRAVRPPPGCRRRRSASARHAHRGETARPARPRGWECRSALDDTADFATLPPRAPPAAVLGELPTTSSRSSANPAPSARACGRSGTAAPVGHPAFVSAALHHRWPELLPHVGRTTRLQFLPHLVEGDSGVEAVIHRELRANAAAFAALESTVGALLEDGDVPLTRLRLHDVLVWLSGSLRLAHAVRLGADTAEWVEHVTA